MVTRWMWRTAAVLAAVLLAGSAGDAAARGRQGPGPRGPGAGPGPGGPMVDDEMREALEEVMRVRLKQVLQMTPEQEGRVMPRVEKLQEARHEFASRRRRAVSHLRAVMMDETAAAADVEKALREVRAIETSFREQEAALRADIGAELDPRQQARLYFFEERFRREMQRRLSDGRPGPRGPGRTGAGGPPQGSPGTVPDDTDSDAGGEGEL